MFYNLARISLDSSWGTFVSYLGTSLPPLPRSMKKVPKAWGRAPASGHWKFCPHFRQLLPCIFQAPTVETFKSCLSHFSPSKSLVFEAKSYHIPPVFEKIWGTFELLGRRSGKYCWAGVQLCHFLAMVSTLWPKGHCGFDGISVFFCGTSRYHFSSILSLLLFP